MTQIKDTPHDCFTIISLNIQPVKRKKVSVGIWIFSSSNMGYMSVFSVVHNRVRLLGNTIFSHSGSGYTQNFIRNIHTCGNEVISLRYLCTLWQHFRPVQTHVDIGDWLGIRKNLDPSYKQG